MISETAKSLKYQRQFNQEPIQTNETDKSVARPKINIPEWTQSEKKRIINQFNKQPSKDLSDVQETNIDRNQVMRQKLNTHFSYSGGSSSLNQKQNQDINGESVEEITDWLLKI